MRVYFSFLCSFIFTCQQKLLEVVLFFKAARGKCIHQFKQITERPGACLFFMTFDFTILLMQATETA